MQNSDSPKKMLTVRRPRLCRDGEIRLSLRENNFANDHRLRGRLEMAEYNFQLRGWHALVGIAALLGYLGIEMYLRVRTVDDGMRNAVRERLLNEYSGRGPKDIARIVAEAREGSSIEPVPEVVQRDVQFTSIAAHGRMGASVTLVRAEIRVDGGPPPDGRSVRYFRVSRNFMEGGWMVVGESDPYFYYRELAP
jgi:hypothetical protein